MLLASPDGWTPRESLDLIPSGTGPHLKDRRLSTNINCHMDFKLQTSEMISCSITVTPSVLRKKGDTEQPPSAPSFA